MWKRLVQKLRLTLPFTTVSIRAVDGAQAPVGAGRVQSLAIDTVYVAHRALQQNMLAAASDSFLLVSQHTLHSLSCATSWNTGWHSTIRTATVCHACMSNTAPLHLLSQHPQHSAQRSQSMEGCSTAVHAVKGKGWDNGCSVTARGAVTMLHQGSAHIVALGTVHVVSACTHKEEAQYQEKAFDYCICNLGASNECCCL